MLRERENGLRRYLRGAAVLIVMSAATIWLQPITVPGSDQARVACGSPASPIGGELVTLLCATDLGNRRIMVGALMLAAAMTLMLGEWTRSWWTVRPWMRGVLLALPIGLSLATLSAGSVFMAVGAVHPDGSRIHCGTLRAPHADDEVQSLCSALQEERRVQAIGGSMVGVGLLVVGAYVTHRRPDEQAGHRPLGD